MILSVERRLGDSYFEAVLGFILTYSTTRAAKASMPLARACK